MARQQVRPIRGPSEIIPVAQPVKTYVRPADPARSSLHDLADGLASLDAGLSGFLDKRRKEQESDDKIRAEAAFNKNNCGFRCDRAQRSDLIARSVPR